MIIQNLPVFSEVFTRSQQSATVRAAGTSVPTCFPAFMAAMAIGWCHSHGVAIYTPSKSSFFNIFRKSSSPLLYTFGSGCPAFFSTVKALFIMPSSISQIAGISTSCLCVVKFIIPCPRRPVPIKPTRSRLLVTGNENNLLGYIAAPELNKELISKNSRRFIILFIVY